MRTMQEQIRFDGWTLLRPTGELVRGAVRVRLQGQPMQVLEAMLERPGELVTREHLIARLWPGGVVVDFDTALNSAIRRLRTALDDHAESPRYIETIPRRGYRFIGHIELAEPSSASVDTANSDANANPISIATANAETAPHDGAIATSLADTGVASPFRKTRRHNRFAVATAVVLGLLAAGTWLALELRATRTGESGTVEMDHPTSIEAREPYERARFFFGRREEGDMARALALFRDALRADPGFAAAWAGIAGVHWIDTMEGRSPRVEGLALVRQAAEQALLLDPRNAEALVRLANYHRITGDKAAAEQSIRRAAVLAPDDPLVLTILSSQAMRAGRFDEAVALQRKSVQHNPLASTPRHNLVMLLFVAGQYDEARAEFAALSALSPPRLPPATVIGQSMLLTGDYSGTLRYAQELPAGVVREQLEALAYFALGRRHEADAALERLAADPSLGAAQRVAEVHAYRGDTDAAFDWLRRSLEGDAADCAENECWPEDWLVALPLLRSLHADPRWQDIQTALLAPEAPRRRS
jgi:DNA-binding winged helix-turn-helix (wHTH) protein/tetratricopeptide (TPR) repeat protein